MKILIGNHWLRKLGGSETFTYTLAGELARRNYEVDLFCNVGGRVANRIKSDYNVGTKLRDSYDLILANHHTIIDQVYHLGYTVQTVHGTIPKLEKPSLNADVLVAISDEIKDFRRCHNVIWNGIDCERFAPLNEINETPKKLLSLVHSDKANILISKACAELGIEFKAINKYETQIWDVENHINEADLVVSLGRGAYEAMACGRPVIVFDSRPYQESFADGYVNEENILESIKFNCSGRRYKKVFGVEDLKKEILKYNKADGKFLREFALENLNVRKQVSKYLKLI